MSISSERFQFLENKYGDVASWAIWDPNNRKDPTIIRRNVDDLNPSLVMVGLNISASLPNKWSNFHIGPKDGKLMQAFNTEPYRGAYMTDLIKYEIEANSANIMSLIRDGAIDPTKHAASFKEEMADVGANRETLFIVFGGLASNLFKKHLVQDFPRWISVRHYSDRVSAEAWAIETLSRISPI